MNTRNIIIIAAATVVALVLSFLFGLYHGMLPQAAGAEAEVYDALFNGMLVVATFIFLLVQGVLLYSAIKFRRRPGDDGDGPPIHGNNKLEVVWTAIPAIIVIVIAVVSYQVLVGFEEPAEDELVVEVTARQFFWEFHYPEYDVSLRNELRLPAGRTTYLRMTSGDVIHAFWVPELRIKKDAVPGMITEARITPLQTGQYRIVCAELCGAGHGIMVADLEIMEAGAFLAWLELQAEPEAEEADTDDPVAFGHFVFNQ